MKKLLSLLLLSLLLVGCGKKAPNAAEVPTETEPTVKTVYVHSSITRTQGTTIGRTDYIYNDENLLTDVIMSDGEGNELQRYLVTCDENGNPIEWASADDHMVAYTYDNRGRTLRTETYVGENLMTSTEYTWSGNLRISVTVKAASQEQRTEYAYDEKGGLTRQDVYVGGALSSYGLYTVNDEGKPVLCQTFDPEGNPVAEVTYEYEDNNEKRITKDVHGKVLQTQILTYDDQGNLLKSDLVDGTGAVVSSEIHEWLPLEVSVDAIRASV
jgi:YD repeat-containing protein